MPFVAAEEATLEKVSQGRHKPEISKEGQHVASCRPAKQQPQKLRPTTSGTLQKNFPASVPHPNRHMWSLVLPHLTDHILMLLKTKGDSGKLVHHYESFLPTNILVLLNRKEKKKH